MIGPARHPKKGGRPGAARTARRGNTSHQRVNQGCGFKGNLLREGLLLKGIYSNLTDLIYIYMIIDLYIYIYV